MLDAIFKAYDVRGVYPEEVNEETAWRVGVGVGALLRDEAAASGEEPDRINVVVGRDMRQHSPGIAAKLVKGITSQGVGVIDVGLVDTPFVYFAIHHLGAHGGVQVTASHNPPEYNGFKVSRARAKPVGQANGLDAIKELARAAAPENAAGTTGGVERVDLWDDYRAHVGGFLDTAAIAARPLKIVADASNGMAGQAVPRLFGENGSLVKGLEIHELHYVLGQGFAHEPNPLVESNLGDLKAAVVANNADLGVCFDGDADRCVLVDEKGQTVGCDLVTAWLAQGFLRKDPGAAVVYDLRSSRAVQEAVRAAGGEPVKSKVGHVFMKQLLAERVGVFGGELSGHFYFKDNFYADSGVIAMAAAVSELARDGRPISQIIEPFTSYARSGERNFQCRDKDRALKEVKKTFENRGAVDELDGVSVDCFDGEGWWANVRKSNTEPLLRLNLEARDKTTAERAMTELTPMLGTPVEH